MPFPILAGAVLVAQLSAVRHRPHFSLLAGGLDWTYCPDLIPACPNPLSQEPRVVGIL